jgi:hypothetical protein
MGKFYYGKYWDWKKWKNENLSVKTAQMLNLFRQSLRISPKRETCDMPEYHNIFMALKNFDKVG